MNCNVALGKVSDCATILLNCWHVPSQITCVLSSLSFRRLLVIQSQIRVMQLLTGQCLLICIQSGICNYIFTILDFLNVLLKTILLCHDNKDSRLVAIFQHNMGNPIHVPKCLHSGFYWCFDTLVGRLEGHPTCKENWMLVC